MDGGKEILRQEADDWAEFIERRNSEIARLRGGHLLGESPAAPPPRRIHLARVCVVALAFVIVYLLPGPRPIDAPGPGGVHAEASPPRTQPSPPVVAPADRVEVASLPAQQQANIQVDPTAMPRTAMPQPTPTPAQSAPAATPAPAPVTVTTTAPTAAPTAPPTAVPAVPAPAVPAESQKPKAQPSPTPTPTPACLALLCPPLN